MNNNKMREEFEKWYLREFSYSTTKLTPMRDTYLSPFVAGLWSAWKASRESLCIELPSSYNSDGDPWFAGYNCALEDVVDILKETGVNYK